jgi:hypothetical protein
MAYATQTLRNAAADFENRIASAVCSGIVGDSQHGYGYHRSFNEVAGSGDYSTQLPGDRNGIDPDAADAVDMSMNPQDMIAVTGRFYRSWKDPNDPRLNSFREIIGTLDGRTVIYMDTQSGDQGSSDDSHLWHVHSGGMRCYVNNGHVWQAWVSIAVGESWADYCRNHPDDPIVHGAQPTPTPEPDPVEEDMPTFTSHRVLPGSSHDEAGNLILANITEVGLPMSGSLWKDKSCYLSLKADFGRAKFRYAVSYDAGSGKTDWKIGEIVVDSTKPRGGPEGAVIPVPPKADGVSLFREPLDATDKCDVPVALIVEIG